MSGDQQTSPAVASVPASSTDGSSQFLPAKSREWSLKAFWPLLVGCIFCGFLPGHKQGFPHFLYFVLGLLFAYFQENRDALERALLRLLLSKN